MSSSSQAFGPTYNKRKNSRSLLERAAQISASRRRDLEGTFPVVIERARGAAVWDLDDNRYIDFTASTGAILLGYRHPEVDAAVIEQIQNRGTLFPTTISEIQIRLAQRISRMFPCAERVLFFRTGSCATTAAVRLARVYSGRTKVLTSGYHGWHDWHLHIFPRFEFSDDGHLDFRYNLNLLEAMLKAHAGDVACVIITPEPTFFPPEYFAEIRSITRSHDTLLIFDEVMSGFRFGRGGVHKHFGVTPDLITLGKGLANGYALSAVGGRGDVMAARDRTHLAGTFAHETTPMAASLATIEIFERENIAARLDDLGGYLLEGLRRLFHNARMPIVSEKYPALFHIIFEIEEAAELFYAELLTRGVMMHPFDPQMVTAAHTREDIDNTLIAVKETLDVLIARRPDWFNYPLDTPLSQAVLDFRTLHEFGGTVRYRDPIPAVPARWDQVDR